MKEFKLIVAGGHTFNDIDLLERVLIAMQDTELADKDISFVTAMEPGADALTYMFANKHDIKCYEFNINKRHGVDAVMRRNAEMADFADGLVVFCNPDEDMDYMIDFMKIQNKPVTVVEYAH